MQTSIKLIVTIREQKTAKKRTVGILITAVIPNAVAVVTVVVSIV